MGGVDRDEHDVSHVIACAALQVPCDDNDWIKGWVGSKIPLKLNLKREDSEITKQQYDGLETILRQWDCLYANAFEWAEEKGQIANSSSRVSFERLQQYCYTNQSCSCK